MTAFPINMGWKLRSDWPTVNAEKLCGVCEAPCLPEPARPPAPVYEGVFTEGCYRNLALRGYILRSLFAPNDLESPLLCRVLACLLTERVFAVDGDRLCVACWWDLRCLMASGFNAEPCVYQDWARYLLNQAAPATAGDAFKWGVWAVQNGWTPYAALLEVARVFGVSDVAKEYRGLHLRTLAMLAEGGAPREAAA